MDLEKEVHRGNEAAQILNSALFKEVCAAVHEGITNQMASVPVHDEKMHTRLIVTLQLWNGIQLYLNKIKQDGEVAAFHVLEEERKRRFFQFGA